MFRKKGLSFRRKDRPWIKWVASAVAAVAVLVCLFIFVFVPLMDERNEKAEMESRIADRLAVSVGENTEEGETFAEKSDDVFKIVGTEPTTEEMTKPTEPATDENGELVTTPSEDELREIKAKEIMAGMTLAQKVYQLFIVTPEDITGVDAVTMAGEKTRDALINYPVGGIVYYRQNFSTREKTGTMLKTIEDYAMEVEGMPLFLMVAEDGGKNGRVSAFKDFKLENKGSLTDVGSYEDGLELGKYIGGYLSDIGFNVNLAPNTKGLSVEAVNGIEEGLGNAGVMCCLRNFPGDETGTLTAYEGYPYSQQNFDQLKEGPMKAFVDLDSEKVPFIMASHICIPYITNDRTPTCLSYQMVTNVLKGTLGYDGIIISSTLCDKNVREAYGWDTSCFLALQAGCDMIFEPTNLQSAAGKIIGYVQSNDLSESRIDESVLKIIKLKLKMMGQ